MEEQIQEALNLLKENIENVINYGKYVPMSEEVVKKESKVTVKYISKRLGSFINSCPYKVEFVEYEDDMLDGEAIKYNKLITIKESNPSQTQFETLIHEWAHNILHNRRNAIELDYFTRELEAESVSFIVGYVLGTIDMLSHSYIFGKLEDIVTTKEDRLNLLNQTYKTSEKRIIRTVNKILNTLQFTINMINYHKKYNGEKL